MTTQICHSLKYRVSSKRVKLVKIAIIKMISIFLDTLNVHCNPLRRNHHNHHHFMLLMMMVMMGTTLRRTLSEKGRVTVLYCQLYCTVLHLEEDAE